MRHRRPHFATLLILLAVAQGQLRARELTTVAPETVGLSSARLERIPKNLDQLIEQEKLAGAVTLVARRGKVAQLLASGWQDKENKIPMKANTIFRIASMTKPVTSVAVMMLHEEGRFQLEDPISKFLPQWNY